MANQIEALSVPGNRGRAACERAEALGAPLATALRRAVPFLARRRLGVESEAASCMAFAKIAESDGLVHATPFAIRSAARSTVRGLVLLDDVAFARILDGVLGGEGNAPETPPEAAPTSAQIALAARVTANMLKSFSAVMSPVLGATVEPTPNKEIEAGTAVVLTLAIEGGGRVLIAIPLSAIGEEEAAQTGEHPVDSGIAKAMTDVELDVVAELGKVRLSLEAISRFQVGDVIRLSLPLDERARVCAGGATLFFGRPTASGETVAVAIERQAM